MFRQIDHHGQDLEVGKKAGLVHENASSYILCFSEINIAAMLDINALKEEEMKRWKNQLGDCCGEAWEINYLIKFHLFICVI